MKLKNMLVLAFLILTFIPILIVTVLLYKSGFGLSKESYLRNLNESINVQADYISQTIENNMVSDYRFANRNVSLLAGGYEIADSNLYEEFNSYLQNSEDKIAVCMLLDRENSPVYTVGEKAVLDSVISQLPQMQEQASQSIMEFDLGNQVYSLGIVTPILDSSQTYIGSLVSVYDKSYLFKIISSYYKITDTSTYICRESGEVIHSRGGADQDTPVIEALNGLEFQSKGSIELRAGNTPVSGCYKNIYNSTWYLVGVINYTQIYAFLNQFIWAYIVIIGLVLIADVVLAVSFSQKVVEPINALIFVMDGYPDSLKNSDIENKKKDGYFETRYLRTKFLELMKTIMLVQHNFEGVYQLYQSSTMDDTNIDIDVKNQTIHSNKEVFAELMEQVRLKDEGCIVERFIRCFSEKDQVLLTDMFETMRDEHLAVTREAEIFTSYLNQRYFHVLVVPMYEDDRLSRLFIQLRDISNFKKQEFQSIEQAKREPLTGLYNRSGFSASAAAILEKSQQNDMHALLFLDMNDFKLVNDNLGHSAGDEVLCTVARVLMETIGPEDVASRFGGDEFAIFLPHTSAEAIESVKQQLTNRLVFPFHTDKLSFTICASIGVSVWDSSSPHSLESLLEIADVAMYQRKRELKQTMNQA